MKKGTKYLTCGYCSVGCNMEITYSKESKPIVRARNDYPVNLGKACPKGFQLLAHLDSPERVKQPYIRSKNGELKSTDWDTALQEFTDNFKNIQDKYGKKSVAFISTGQITNEEHALLGSLAKFGMGMIHGDGNTRQCMATAVVAHKKSFGWDAPPFTYKDAELSNVLIFMGSNPAISHPILWNRVKMNKKDPKLVIIDPRVTETVDDEMVTDHYQIKPGSELIFLYTLANILIEKDWIDNEYIKQHTNDFKGFKTHVSRFKPTEQADFTGITPDKMEHLAELIHQGESVSFWWMVGVNQAHQATRTAQGLINLALMTGNIGRPGTGANSITGQCNAMGARIFSNTTALLGGYSFTKDDDRRHIADILGINHESIPKVGSYSYEKILEAIEDGEIKGLWIICTNPAHSWIDSNRIPEIFSNLDYLVVQDLYYTTETAQLADLILPAAGCGEKDGTFINSERRIGILQKILEPPGEALSDFDIFLKIADAWGCGNMFKHWKDPETTFNLIKKLTAGQPWDFSGIKDYQMLIENGGIQWPLTKKNSGPIIQERRLLETGEYYFEDKKAKFQYEEIKPVPEPTNEKYPFVLLTGRGSMWVFHTQTRTGKAKLLRRRYPTEPYVEINAIDARELDISDGDEVIIESRRDKVSATAKISEKMLQKNVFLPLHYKITNQMTYWSFDEYSKEPNYKFAAVNLRKQE